MPTVNPIYPNLSAQLREAMQRLSLEMTTASGLATTSVPIPKLPIIKIPNVPNIKIPKISKLGISTDIQVRMMQNLHGGTSSLPKAPKDDDSQTSMK